MEPHGHQTVVEGISVSSTGQATVSPAVTGVLFDLALALEPSIPYPVDVQHVLAAVVLAAKNNQLQPDAKLSASDQALLEVLRPHVISVFKDFGGKLGAED